MEQILGASANPPHDLLTDEQVEHIGSLQREAALRDYRERIPPGNLDSEHNQIFAHALGKVLNTDLALLTFAQIIDGLPITDVALDRVDECYWPEDGHPVEDHEELCPGALDKARELRKTWGSSMLRFSPKVCSFRCRPSSSVICALKRVLISASACASLSVSQAKHPAVQYATHRVDSRRSPPTRIPDLQNEA